MTIYKNEIICHYYAGVAWYAVLLYAGISLEAICPFAHMVKNCKLLKTGCNNVGAGGQRNLVNNIVWHRCNKHLIAD